jgi:iron complex outermembrane receptor protein
MSMAKQSIRFNTFLALRVACIPVSYLFFCWLLSISRLQAQPPATLTGRVTNEKGIPLDGATIKAGSTTTLSNLQGIFSLAPESLPTQLTISYTGYATQVLTIGDKASLEVQLSPIADSLGVTIVGSRSMARGQLQRAVPVDIYSAQELQKTQQIELGQQLQFTVPSFNSAKYAINGALGYTDYATLRGMGPDQLLVLVNGKRRHQFSVPHIGFSISRGMVVTDLNAMPFLAFERTEVLRDGAASLYGSDAIAGIINLKLRETVQQGTVRTQLSTTHKGDGTNFLAAINYGFKLGKEKSYFNFTLHQQCLGETNRSDPFTGRIYNSNQRIDDSIRAARGVWPATGPFRVGVFGASRVDQTQGFFNAGYPINDQWKLYSFGGYSYKEGLVYGFFRNAIPANANSNPAIFPDGFTPEFPAKSRDLMWVAGAERTLKGGWNWDLSTGIGHNGVRRFARNTVNASLGSASPTEFFVGSSSFTQSTTEVNLSKHLPGALNFQSLHLAFGSQLRIDNYKQGKGDDNSYIAGPLALSQNKTPGTQGIAATSPDDVANESRTNVGVYADAEANITEAWLLSAALRFEHYSDFGGNLSGKIATRYRITPQLTARASVNRGFRAPSMQQLYNSATATLVQAGQIAFTKQFRADDPVLPNLGIDFPKPEIAMNYNAGLVWQPVKKLTFTADFFRIDVQDKIVLSEALRVASIPALTQQLAGTGIQQVSFFTNHIDTRTTGLDVIANYRETLGKGNLHLSVAAAFNQTKVVANRATPAKLQQGASGVIRLIDTINIALIETAQPREKIIFSATYSIGKLQLTGRATYFGEVAAWERTGNNPHIKQVFGGKTLVDVSASIMLLKNLQWSLGSNNVGNVYPDRVLPTLSAYGSGQTPFNRNVNQFGFAGATYFTSLAFQF